MMISITAMLPAGGYVFEEKEKMYFGIDDVIDIPLLLNIIILSFVTLKKEKRP